MRLYKNIEIPPGKKKQELLAQAHSQAGAWEREVGQASPPDIMMTRIV